MLNIKKLLTKILNGFGVVRSYGTANITAGQMYVLTTITLAKNSKWLILADLSDNVAPQHYSYVNINVSAGNPTLNWGIGQMRNNVSNGGVCNTWKYIETGASDATVQLRTYGYYTTSNTSEGRIVAIRLGGGTA